FSSRRRHTRLSRDWSSDVCSSDLVKGRTAVGALVGYARSSNISHAYAAGTVSGTNNVGGLVGYQSFGSVTQAYATGDVTGTNYEIGRASCRERLKMWAVVAEMKKI